MQLIVVLLATVGTAAAQNPIEKVTQLLSELQQKILKEGEAEQKNYEKFATWCKDEAVAKQYEIEDGKSKVAELKAVIEKESATILAMESEIEVAAQKISTNEADLKSATEIREKEASDFAAADADMESTIDMLSRAIGIIDKNMRATGLVQMGNKQVMDAINTLMLASSISTDDKSALTALVQQGQEESDDFLARSAPDAKSYESHSGSILDTLEDMKEKAVAMRNKAQKEEMNAKHAFEMMVQELVDSIEAAEKERSRHATNKAQRMQDAAGAKGDLADTTSSRDEDQKYLDSLVAQCSQKSTDFEARQQLRAEELEAIAKAVEILASGAVSGNADKHLPGLLQTKKALVQLRATALRSPVQKNVAAFLQGRADKLQSRILSLVATKVSEDPFEKVKKMIKDLIVRLMEEANEEAEHKGWCDTELASNKQTRESKSQEVDSLTAQADQLTADIGKLAEDISDLTSAIAEIDAAVAKATEVRTAEKAKNAETVKDAQEAQTAVAQALAVLKEFYAKAAEATALVQQPEADAPETFDTAYTGMGAESGGVVGMIEVIQSDFARLEAETSSSESEAAREFDRFSAESAQDKAVKSTTLDHKEKTKTSKESDLNDTKKDLKGTQAELDAALEYYDKLKPSCVDAGVNYEDRVKRRQDEIESLQEALRILAGEDIA